MAILPVIEIDRSLHSFSLEFDRMEREINRRLVVIGNMDENLRETWGLAMDVIACQVETIQLLQELEQSGQLMLEGRASKFKDTLDEKIKEVRGDYLENYKSLLGARDAYIAGDGSKIQLTKEKKQELFSAFEERLDAKLADYEGVVSLDQNADLQKIRESLEEIQGTKEKNYNELFDQKQELSEKCHDLEFLCKKLHSKKISLFREGLKVQDLYLASQVGDVEFIKNCKDLKQKVNQLDAQKQFAPLHYAAYHNQAEAMKELVIKGKADPTIKDGWGNQPIHWAAKQGSYRAISYLMTLPSKLKMINAQGEYGRTPLHRSIYNGRMLTTELLLREGADPNIPAEGDGGVTSLHVAVESRSKSMIQMLLRHSRFEVMKGDAQKHSSIHRAITLGLEDIVVSLLNHRSVPPFGQTMPELDALLACARRIKHKGILKLLLLRDVDQKLRQKWIDEDSKVKQEIENEGKRLKKQKISPKDRKEILQVEEKKILQRSQAEMAEYEEALHQSMQEELDSIVQEMPSIAKSDPENTLLSIEEFGQKILEGESSSLPISEASTKSSKSYFSEKEEKAKELNEIGMTEFALENYVRALKYCKKALEIRKELFKMPHKDLANSLNNVGIILTDLDRYVEALDYHQRALKMRRTLFKDPHKDIVSSLDQIGMTLTRLGRCAEALKYHQQALEMVQKLFKSPHEDLANSLNTVAMALANLDRNAEALECFQQALEIRQKLFKGPHEDLADSLDNIGKVLGYLGKYAEALKYAELALEERRQLFEDPDEDLIQSLHNVGMALSYLKRDEEALDYFMRALEMGRELFEEPHPTMAFLLNSTGMRLNALLRHEEALKFCQQALEMRRALFGDKHFDIVDSLHAVEKILGDLGKHQEAIIYKQQALEIEKVLGIKEIKRRSEKISAEITFATSSSSGSSLGDPKGKEEE